jgi:gingipain R
MKKLVFSLLLIFISASIIHSQVIRFGNGNPGITANVLESNSSLIRIEYIFGGFYQNEINIDGKQYVYMSAPGMVSTMEKGMPEIPIFRSSVIIPDLPAMNFRIIEQETEILSLKNPVIPSKGHLTRDIDINSVPYSFSPYYYADDYYPQNVIKLDEPYIIRDFRGMTVQLNSIQYNSSQNILKVYKRIVIEIYQDGTLNSVNPFYRQFPLTKVANEFAGIYRGLFINYGIGNSRYDSIPEPGRMLVIYPASYLAAITPFIQWKMSRLTVLTAEYPAQTGSGSAAIKTYIQNLYNTTEKITYIVLVGDVADIPTMNGVYESAPSDPCYVKLAGTDAYPDAFISRISCQNAASVGYVGLKCIKFERDIEVGNPWFSKATGIGGPDVGGSPPYADSIRMNWIRDTLLAHGFTQVDKINGPSATPTHLINSLNDGRYILNYVGHGSGTSWSNTGFSVTNSYQLSNGWKNPYLVDVACLNGNLTLNECLAESLLRAGDSANPKGCVAIYASSTNASWVPPCDMQTHSMYLFAHQYRKTVGAVSFFGVMKAMDMWGGSTGEGLKLMEQYNIFGDCSLLLSRGVPLGPAISHSPLPNSENLAGPYVVNCVINQFNSGINPSKTKVFWTRGTVFNDSVQMTRTTGNNWTANIPGNNQPAVYRYYIKTADSLNRVSTSPGGAPSYFHSFTANADTINPVITHTPLQNTPKLSWPATVTANVTDNFGIDSVWVNWKKNYNGTAKRFRLNNTSGSTYSAPFNSTQLEVNVNDTIFYRIIAQDNGSNHKKDSTALYNFKIISQATVIIGTGTTSCNFPFTTYWMDGRTNLLFTASEIIAAGGGAGFISKIAFNVISADPAPLNGFNVKMQHTTATSLTGFTTTGWTTCYNGVFTLPGTGWQNINLTSPFQWNGTSNLLVEVCYNNSAYTQYSPVYASAATGMYWGRYGDLSTGDGCATTSWSSTTSPTGRPNIRMVIDNITGLNNNTTVIPQTFSLSQNYPNPFNPVTKISFDIPKTVLTKLTVYDILGREIMKLVNEVKQPGQYVVDFDGAKIASGVYYYKLEAGTYMNVKKMLLIK